MNELIKIEVDQGGNQSVRGRELHKALEIKGEYKKWFNRMTTYGFREEFDYFLDRQTCRTNNPKNPDVEIVDHVLTIDMAKHVAMIQRNEKGMRIREYFIEAEKQFVSNLLVLKNEINSRSFEIDGQNIPFHLISSISKTNNGTLTIRFDSSFQKLCQDTPKNVTANQICNITHEYSIKIFEFLGIIQDTLSPEQYNELIQDLYEIFWVTITGQLDD